VNLNRVKLIQSDLGTQIIADFEEAFQGSGAKVSYFLHSHQGVVIITVAIVISIPYPIIIVVIVIVIIIFVIRSVIITIILVVIIIITNTLFTGPSYLFLWVKRFIVLKRKKSMLLCSFDVSTNFTMPHLGF